MSRNDTRIWLTAPPLLAAIAPLAGCDENSTTAPEEPPRERVVEATPAIVETDVHFFEFEAFLYYPDGSVVLYKGGSVYNFAASAAADAAFPPDPEALKHIPSLANREVAPTHETANWGDFELCDDCELMLAEIVRFGDADGAGMVEKGDPIVSWSAELGYVVAGSTFLQVFDHEGRFVRRIGREGEEPGEFGAVADAHVVDGRLLALDRVTKAWSIFNLAGEFVDRRPYGHQAGAFIPVGGSRVVVVNRDRSPEADGSPLHLVQIDSGVPSRHFGSRDAWEYNWEAKPHAGNVQGSVTSRPGTVWWGATGSPRVQEWSVDDELLRVIEGELPWFPEVTEFIDPTREPPSTLLRSLALDNQEHLWMTVRTADPQWREVELERTPQGHRAPPERRGDYMDTRLDIFDLEEQRHIGRYVWDSPYARLINVGLPVREAHQRRRRARGQHRRVHRGQRTAGSDLQGWMGRP